MKLDFTEDDIDQSKDDGFKPLPEGEYVVLIEQVEPKGPNDEGWRGLNFKLQVVDGQYRGRLLFDNLFTTHCPPIPGKPEKDEGRAKAENIGRNRLLELAYSCGLPGLPAEDVLEYVNKTARVSLGVEEDKWKSKGEGKLVQKNYIKKILFDKGAVPRKPSSRETVSVGADHAQHSVEPVSDDALPF